MIVSMVPVVSPVLPFSIVFQLLCMVESIFLSIRYNSVNLMGVKNLLCTTHQVVYFCLFHLGQSLMVICMYLANCCSEFGNSVIQLSRAGPGESFMWV